MALVTDSMVATPLTWLQAQRGIGWTGGGGVRWALVSVVSTGVVVTGGVLAQALSKVAANRAAVARSWLA